MKNYTRIEKHYDEDNSPSLYSSIYYNDEDQMHRTDGPAVEWEDGSKVWVINNMYHRLDGPAEIYVDGDMIRKFYSINNKRYSEQDFNNHPEVIAYRNEQKLRKKLGL